MLASPSLLKLLDDMSRASLEGMRDWYANCIFWSTFAVIVGCALEVPEVLDQLWPSLFDRRFERLIKMVSSIGLLFVVLGVSGELAFEHWRSGYEELLQEFDNVLLVDAETHAALAQQDAGDAKDSAKNAAAASVRATSSAKAASAASTDAIRDASAARKEADSFEQNIAAANKTAAEAEEHLADALREAAQAEAELKRIRSPRSISYEPSVITALVPFKGTEYTLNVFQDDEAFQMAKIVDRILGAAGWIRKQPSAHNIGITYFNILSQDSKDAVPVCVETGIQIHVQEKEPLGLLQSTSPLIWPKTLRAASALMSALGPNILPLDERNIGKNVQVDRDPGDGPVSICVGKKP